MVIYHVDSEQLLCIGVNLMIHRYYAAVTLSWISVLVKGDILTCLCGVVSAWNSSEGR